MANLNLSHEGQVNPDISGDRLAAVEDRIMDIVFNTRSDKQVGINETAILDLAQLSILASYSFEPYTFN
jgi:hypothetical protein